MNRHIFALRINCRATYRGVQCKRSGRNACLLLWRIAHVRLLSRQGTVMLLEHEHWFDCIAVCYDSRVLTSPHYGETSFVARETWRPNDEGRSDGLGGGTTAHTSHMTYLQSTRSECLESLVKSGLTLLLIHLCWKHADPCQRRHF